MTPHRRNLHWLQLWSCSLHKILLAFSIQSFLLIHQMLPYSYHLPQYKLSLFCLPVFLVIYIRWYVQARFHKCFSHWPSLNLQYQDWLQQVQLESPAPPMANPGYQCYHHHMLWKKAVMIITITFFSLLTYSYSFKWFTDFFIPYMMNGYFLIIYEIKRSINYLSIQSNSYPPITLQLLST